MGCIKSLIFSSLLTFHIRSWIQGVPTEVILKWGPVVNKSLVHEDDRSLRVIEWVMWSFEWHLLLLLDHRLRFYQWLCWDTWCILYLWFRLHNLLTASLVFDVHLSFFKLLEVRGLGRNFTGHLIGFNSLMTFGIVRWRRGISVSICAGQLLISGVFSS